MSCLNPTKRFRLIDGTVVTCERKLNDPQNPPLGGHFYTPCGQCGECRLSRARTWATRCVHESQQWDYSCFITLTYAETPPGNSLAPEDTRNFIRRLRDHLSVPFKYFLVGEYGDNFDRPHYHALIFGTDFGLHRSKSIESPFSKNKKADDQPASNLQLLHNTEALSCPELNDIWGHGYTSVGHLTFDSAAYCAQYAMKKINGPMAKNHYGEKHPEFMRTSQNAIGKDYALKYAKEIIESNKVISNGTEQQIPQYYLKLYQKPKSKDDVTPLHDLTELKILREEFSQDHSLEKSYIRACKLDAKFKNKASKKDKLLIHYFKHEYLTEDFLDNVTKINSK